MFHPILYDLTYLFWHQLGTADHKHLSGYTGRLLPIKCQAIHTHKQVKERSNIF